MHGLPHIDMFSVDPMKLIVIVYNCQIIVKLLKSLYKVNTFKKKKIWGQLEFNPWGWGQIIVFFTFLNC